MRISDWSADVCSSDLVPNGSIRDIAGQWMAGSPAYDPAAITIPTMVIVGAADTDTPPALAREESGRASCRERVCQYVQISGVAVSLKNKTLHTTTVHDRVRNDRFSENVGF